MKKQWEIFKPILTQALLLSVLLFMVRASHLQLLLKYILLKKRKKKPSKLKDYEEIINAILSQRNGLINQRMNQSKEPFVRIF